MYDTVKKELIDKYKALVDYIETDVLLNDGIASWEAATLRKKIKEIRKNENS